ncbi:hypothetical protein [Hymenobacter lapidarius]|uniref:hypothetical protein n=1 Tax=Hymenobacter lapidarius TaxID=1908237 RepID=UPI0008A5AAE3|nr:hypothetical protein [Hymenobacter lapidarius]
MLRPQQLTKETTLPGELLAYERVELRAKVPAFVRRMAVDIGAVVRRGQVLAGARLAGRSSRAGNGQTAESCRPGWPSSSPAAR